MLATTPPYPLTCFHAPRRAQEDGAAPCRARSRLLRFQAPASASAAAANAADRRSRRRALPLRRPRALLLPVVCPPPRLFPPALLLRPPPPRRLPLRLPPRHRQRAYPRAPGPRRPRQAPDFPAPAQALLARGPIPYGARSVRSNAPLGIPTQCLRLECRPRRPAQDRPS